MEGFSERGFDVWGFREGFALCVCGVRGGFASLRVWSPRGVCPSCVWGFKGVLNPLDVILRH